jgi:hypothetical protein
LSEMRCFLLTTPETGSKPLILEPVRMIESVLPTRPIAKMTRNYSLQLGWAAPGLVRCWLAAVLLLENPKRVATTHHYTVTGAISRCVYCSYISCLPSGATKIL